MAYARWRPGSDVYVYADENGGYACERCPEVGQTFRCATAREMIAHLVDYHRARNHLVPDEAIQALLDEPYDD